MTSSANAALKRITRRVQTRIGQRANRTVGTWMAIQGPAASTRIARQAHQLIWRMGCQAHSYKTCLVTEAQCLRAEAAYGPPSPAWAGVSQPITRLVVCALGRRIYAWLCAAIEPLQRIRLHRKQQSQACSAGLFEGLGYRFVSANDDNPADPEAYSQLTDQALSVLQSYRIIQPDRQGKGIIGILISCFHPEEHISGFLDSLLSLESRRRLFPVFINAGMSEACAEMIKTRISQAGFYHSLFLNQPGSGIYEAWNHGVRAMGDSVDFITNFNVDDRCHPLRLDVQAECLNAFPHKQVALTDYIYFFEDKSTVGEIYARYGSNTTRIPTVNARTLTDHNFPHSSPLWRRTLHRNEECGLFDERYLSAGDAEFWYRVSQLYPDSFSVISLPLSLYYQNPRGLSTRPQTVGPSEHYRSTRSHYRHLMERMDAHISSEFAEQHIHPCGPEHLQIFSMASSLKEE